MRLLISFCCTSDLGPRVFKCYISYIVIIIIIRIIIIIIIIRIIIDSIAISSAIICR